MRTPEKYIALVITVGGGGQGDAGLLPVTASGHYQSCAPRRPAPRARALAAQAPPLLRCAALAPCPLSHPPRPRA